MERFKNALLFANLFVMLAVLASLAQAHGGGDPQLIHACINNSSGTIKIISPTGTCASNEMAVDWNKQGPPGDNKVIGFIHRVDMGETGNTCDAGNFTILDHPAINDNPNAIIVVTERTYGNTDPIQVVYSLWPTCGPGRWLILGDSEQIDGGEFNVMVFNP